MEMKGKNSHRSLAYRLAKVIDKDSLSSISGGNQAARMQWTSCESFKASGSNIHSVDVVGDVTVDF